MRKLRTHRGNAILAILALRLGKPVDRSHLAATIWPDSEPSDGMYSLRRTLTDLRQALGGASVAIQSPTPSTVQLDPDLVWVDLAEFDQLIRSVQDTSLSDAVSLYRAPLLAEWRFEWVTLERAIRERNLLEALLRQSDRAEERGDNAAAAEALRLLSTIDPHDESIFRRLLNNLVKAGNLSGAQKAFEDFKRRLRQDLDILPSEQTTNLVRELLSSTPKAFDHSRFVGGNLPLPNTPLVGRRREFAEALQALEDGRMVTLVGSGGVGKTRLSIEIMRDVAASQHQRAVAVDLLSVRDPERLYEAFAVAARSIDPDTQASPGQIVERLAEANVLVLLDNCEHILEPVRVLAKNLLDTCPGIRILATSQASVGLSEEKIIRIEPMPVPDFLDPTLEQVAQNDAVRLMVQYITKAKGGFELSARNFKVVYRICQTLEGVPLALELAATRTRLLSLEQVANLLEDRFRLLRTTEKGIEERHRTLIATMDWSYSLLSDQEKELLQTASVFAGFWTSESAAKVHGNLDSYEVLEVLERLVDRSLVLSDPREDFPRFRLLDSVRQYASDRLAEVGSIDETRDRHLKWFTELCELAEIHMPGGNQRQWVERITSEYENIPAAFSWAKGAKYRTSYALRMSGSLMRYWWIQGLMTAGRETALRSIELPGAKDYPIPYAKTLYTLGALAWSQGDNSECDAYQLQALKIFEENQDLRGAAGALRNLSQSARNQGRTSDAIQFGKRALSAYQAINEEVLAANTLVDMALAAYDLMLFEEAKCYLHQAITYANSQGILPIEAVALLNLGSVCQSQGLLLEAQVALERALNIYDQVGGLILSTMTRNGLAVIRAELGDVQHGKSLLSTSFDTFKELGEKKGVCLTLESAAFVAYMAEEYELSASWLGTTDQMREALNVPRSPAETPEYIKQVETLKAKLEPMQYDRLYRIGYQADPADQVEIANRWLKE